MSLDSALTLHPAAIISEVAATLSSDLLSRARAYGSEHVQTWPAWVEPRVALLSELAVMVAGQLG